MFQSVSARFRVPFLLFLLPIVFMLVSLVSTRDKGIATASNEISGLPSIDLRWIRAGLCCAHPVVARRSRLVLRRVRTRRWPRFKGRRGRRRRSLGGRRIRAPAAIMPKAVAARPQHCPSASASRRIRPRTCRSRSGPSEAVAGHRQHGAGAGQAHHCGRSRAQRRSGCAGLAGTRSCSGLCDFTTARCGEGDDPCIRT